MRRAFALALAALLVVLPLAIAASLSGCGPSAVINPEPQRAASGRAPAASRD